MKSLTRSMIVCVIFGIALSCSRSVKYEAKITFHSNPSGSFFVFSVPDDGITILPQSSRKEQTPEISEVNLQKLTKLLFSNNYCISSRGVPKFRITSRQLTSYDKTFYSFISQVHKLRDRNILSYYGKCL